MAQFLRIVSTSDKTADIINCSVAPTLILGNFIKFPLSLPFELAKESLSAQGDPATLDIFKNEAKYISQMNEMELANFANNLEDYLSV